MPQRTLKTMLAGGVCAFALAAGGMAAAQTRDFDVPAGDLSVALDTYARQSGVQIIYRIADVSGVRTQGAKGALSSDEALAQLLEGTRFKIRRDPSGAIAIADASDPQSASAAGDGADGTVQALIVTAQKREENIQDVPIAMSAFTQEDLTRSQVAGGPDLMTQVPNFTFTKTNFTGYSIQIRGIGTQAISATTDAAVAVAFNNTPFIRNRFFEQEFYDLERVEVLRGPQGTLYGRNATAGVVNLISARPKFVEEARLSVDAANYRSSRLEGMINIPLVEDKVALRIAGAWTKRDGYDTNAITGGQIDGRNLWSARVSLRFEPTDWLRADLIYEHFHEKDDRLRSGKQLCQKDPNQMQFGNVTVNPDEMFGGTFGALSYTTQGCRPASLYAPESFQTPNGLGLPYYGPTSNIGGPVFPDVDPYVSATQSHDLRVIESMLQPEYEANTNLFELQFSADISPQLTLSSETAYSADMIFSFEDFNRFNTKPGAFDVNTAAGQRPGLFTPEGVMCDPQLGCSDRLVAGDLATAASRQFSQEFRLSSGYDGPFNFSVGANFLRYDTEDKYYVFINNLSAMAASSWGQLGSVPYIPGVSDSTDCLTNRRESDPNISYSVEGCIYMDPNGIHSLNDMGRNYFLSKNPYRLISYAVFGETYYNITPNLKLTAGARWTVDKKRAPQIPSWLMAAQSWGYPVRKVIEQEWREPTGRLTLDWKPDLTLTDETLLYASAAHGYKAGGANPPPAILTGAVPFDGEILQASLTHPETFDPEFVNAYEVGSKNVLANGSVTLNLTGFYYDYKGYQISQIVDRAAVNHNFDAEVWGAEIEADWRPLENLRLGFKGGYEKARMADGSSAIDLMDRTAGHTDWAVIKPFPTTPSNCILPVDLLGFLASRPFMLGGFVATGPMGDGLCLTAYKLGLDPITGLPYTPNPTEGVRDELTGYPGFDPTTAPNNGEGFSKDLSGNELPNAPHFTATLTADYTIPLPNDWLATLHTDLYYQSEAWTRIFNTPGYDKLKAYTNVNLAAIFTNEEAGWKVMAYVKNVMNRDSITGAFLNSDDTGLTTNVFLTEPRLYGLRVTKEWTGGAFWSKGAGHPSGEPYPLTVEVGAAASRTDAPTQIFRPEFAAAFASPEVPYPAYAQDEDLDWGDGREIKVTYSRPGGWRVSAAYRKTEANGVSGHAVQAPSPGGYVVGDSDPKYYVAGKYNYADTRVRDAEDHTIVDFAIGKDVGLGAMGEETKSAVTLGLRFAQFHSSTKLSVNGTPDYYMAPADAAKYDLTHHQYEASFEAMRSFKGAGPVASWEASRRLFGDEQNGAVALDWSLSGGVLFGKQNTRIHAESKGNYQDFTPSNGKYVTPITFPGLDEKRQDSVTVPVLQLDLGLSYDIQRLKVSTGYRIVRYFDVLDTGISARRTDDRQSDGPYFKIAVGFGG